MDTTAYTLMANSQPIGGEVSVLYIQVNHEANRIPSARLILEDGDPVNSDFPVSSQLTDLHPGNDLEIFMGKGANKKIIFAGVVIKQNVKLGSTGKTRLVVEAKHPAFRMSLGRKSRQFQKSTGPKTIKDDEVIKKIIKEYGAKPKIPTTEVEHLELIQFQSTDWDFVISRAEANGMICLAGTDTMSFVKPDSSTPSVLPLVMGDNILQMDAELDARIQTGAVKAISWKPSDLEVVEVSGDSGSFEEAGTISASDLASKTNEWGEMFLPHGGARSQPELTEWAKNRDLRNKLAKIRGTVSIRGNAKVNTGDWVDFQGGGDLFNGKLFVGGVRQVYAEGVWTTDLQLGISPKTHAEILPVNDLPAGGLTAAVSGIQIGTVSNIHEDPESQNKIQVRLPVQSQAGLEVKVWARLASLDAGNDRGALFRPEVGDEVVLGFVNGDPRDAILLGMLHSNAHPAPFEAAATQENHLKGIRTRSGMELLFDDEVPAVTLQTPGGNALIIHDGDGAITLQDANNNKIVLDAHGITLESATDILLKATGDIIMEGTNVKAEAQASFKASGNAGAELSASGNTVIKGAIVQIN